MKATRLIQIDWIAAMVAGVLVLSLCPWLARLYALPESLLQTIGIVNHAYACVSLTLALRSRGDTVPYLRVVAAANIAWAAWCVMLTVVWFDQATLLGLVQLGGEALFVGGLGVLEWRAAGRVAPSNA